ncbi:MAG: carbohydrate-binding domain-containing protein [Clostridia bacterium]|nr:carbohydrate-binding domain-containing protein [Clostridia bacterium]
MKKILSLILIICLSITAFAACDNTQTSGGQNPQATPTPVPTPSGNTSTNQGEDDSIIIKCDSWSATITKFDSKGEDDDITTGISLADASTSIDGNGAIYKDGKVVISAAGTYLVTGTLTSGSIIVDVPELDKVHLILKGVTITSKDYAAICVIAGDKVTITLAEGTTNTLTDSANYTFSYSNLVIPNACLFSKEDLTINGKGTLVVKGNHNNGITSKDDLKILDGTYDVTAVNHGIRGNDSVLINGGTIKVYAGNDGIKSSNTLESSKGCILITGGTVNVKATDDGIQAVSAIYITEGKATVECSGKTINCDGAVWTNKGALTEVE